jgi:hypothetical protein
MYQHESRYIYGYIVTDQELICFRRRSTGWGQLDIAPVVLHKVEPDRRKGILNSIYVLFFLHWKLANDISEETGWRLRSFGKEDPPSATSAASVATPMRTAAVAKRVNLLKQIKTDRGQTSGKKLNRLRANVPAAAA